MILDDFGAYIEANTALTLGTDLFLGLMPEEPSDVVALYENSGVPPISTLGSVNRPPITRPELQVLVRNGSYSTGRTLADDIWQLLTAVTNATINGNLYHRVEAISSPFVVERDSNRRVLISCNFNTMKDNVV